MDWLEEAIKRNAIPKHARLDTVEEFCSRFNIDAKQYYYQLSKKENKEKILEIVLNIAKESSPEILEKLVEEAKKGNMKAMDLYLDMILQLSKNLDLKTAGKPIFIPSEIAEKYGIETNTSTEPNS